MGIDLIIYAFDQLGVTMTPFWAWAILVIGILSLAISIIWGIRSVIGIAKTPRGRQTRSQGEASAKLPNLKEPEPQKRSRPIGIRIGKGADDAVIQDSVFIGDIDGIVNEGGKRMQSKGNRFYNHRRER